MTIRHQIVILRREVVILRRIIMIWRREVVIRRREIVIRRGGMATVFLRKADFFVFDGYFFRLFRDLKKTIVISGVLIL